MARLLLAFLFTLWAAAAGAQTPGAQTQRIEAAVNPCADTFLSVSFVGPGCQNDVQVPNYSAISGLSLSAGTITGAGAQVWVPDATGTLQSFGSGVNKITSGGLSLWGSANGNSQIQSNALTNVAYTATGVATVANSPDVLSPDGTHDMTKVTVNGTSARIQSASPWAVATSQSRVVAMVAQPGNQPLVILQPSEGNSPFSGGAAVVAYTSACTSSNSFAFGGWAISSTFFKKMVNGNCLFGMVYVPDAATTTVYEQVNPGITVQSANTGLSAYMGFIQDTPGTVGPVPYVSTAAVAATVTADTATVTCSPGCTDGGAVAMATFSGGDLASIVSASSFNLASTAQPWAGLPLQSLRVTAGAVPAAASAVGYNTVTYSATTFSAANVDTGCVGAITAQIYCAGTNTGYGGWGQPATFINSGFSGTDLLIGGGPNTFNGILVTAMFTGASNPQQTVKGIVFGGGFYAEAVYSLPNILSSGNTFWSGWPSFWELAYESIVTLAPQDQWFGLGSNSCRTFEGDGFEDFLGNFGYDPKQFNSTSNDRYNSAASCGSGQTFLVGPGAGVGTTITESSTAFYQVSHKYAMRWVPAVASAALSGEFSFWVDDVKVMTTPYSACTSSDPAPPSGNNRWCVQDGNFNYPGHFPIIFGSGFISGSGAATTGSTVTGCAGPCVLTVGTLSSGSIIEGQGLQGAGLTTNACRIGALTSAGRGSGSTWSLQGTCANVASEAVTLNSAPNSTQLQLHSLKVWQASDSGNVRGN